ncbi:MAG: hypothetical protein WC881_12340 [Elusimicrobiota bacterium]|jgi:hypothetical protein
MIHFAARVEGDRLFLPGDCYHLSPDAPQELVARMARAGDTSYRMFGIEVVEYVTPEQTADPLDILPTPEMLRRCSDASMLGTITAAITDLEGLSTAAPDTMRDMQDDCEVVAGKLRTVALTLRKRLEEKP